MKSLPQLFGDAKNKRVTVFMDYDGALPDKNSHAWANKHDAALLRTARLCIDPAKAYMCMLTSHLAMRCRESRSYICSVRVTNLYKHIEEGSYKYVKGEFLPLADLSISFFFAYFRELSGWFMTSEHVKALQAIQYSHHGADIN